MQMYNPETMPHPIPNTTETPAMQGFVINYQNAIDKAGQPKKGCSRILSTLFRGNTPMDSDPGIIMNCFTPKSLPVINGLANAYAVCDYWFSSVPTQTFPNRSFVHAATSAGYVLNFWPTGKEPWDIGHLFNRSDTIYNRLSQNGIDWRIYYGGPLLLCNALLIQEKLWEFLPLNRHFFRWNDFLRTQRSSGGLFGSYIHRAEHTLQSQVDPKNDIFAPRVCSLKPGPRPTRSMATRSASTVYEALRTSPDCTARRSSYFR